MSLLLCPIGIVLAFAAGALAAVIATRIAAGHRCASEQDLAAVVAGSPDGLLRFGADLRCTYASPRAASLLDRLPHGLIGAELASLFPVEAHQAITTAVERAYGAGSDAEAHVRSWSAVGDQVWIEARLRRAGDGLVIGLRDVSVRKTTELALRVANTELSRLAGSDSLTGLPNRRRFEQVLESTCRRAARQAAPVSMLLIDIETPFDQAGPRGDQCLKRVAHAISDAVGAGSGTAARFAGEEFAVMLPGRDKAGALAEADRIRDAVVAAGIADGAPRAARSFVAASVGCATVLPSLDQPSDVAATALMAQANRALDRARPLGRAPGRTLLAKPHQAGRRDAAA